MNLFDTVCVNRFLAALILAYHMIAAAVLLNGGPALGALLRVGRDPVGGLAVVVTLLCPLPDQRAPHWVVPVFYAFNKLIIRV
jgi:hypothetical protein